MPPPPETRFRLPVAAVCSQPRVGKYSLRSCLRYGDGWQGGGYGKVGCIYLSAKQMTPSSPSRLPTRYTELTDVFFCKRHDVYEPR
jgi:hypothetical protein